MLISNFKDLTGATNISVIIAELSGLGQKGLKPIYCIMCIQIPGPPWGP